MVVREFGVSSALEKDIISDIDLLVAQCMSRPFDDLPASDIDYLRLVARAIESGENCRRYVRNSVKCYLNEFPKTKPSSVGGSVKSGLSRYELLRDNFRRLHVSLPQIRV